MRDQDLVVRAQAGDQAAFDQLVIEYRAVVFATAYALLGNVHDADDAAQEALTRAWLHLGDLRDPANFAGWLYRITQNCCRTTLLRRQRTASLDDATPTSGQPAELATEAIDAVQVALGALSEPHRRVVTLFYLEGYAVKDIAALLDLPIGTVKRRLHDARRQLRMPARHTTRASASQKGRQPMRLFTRKGDQGTTDLLGARVAKDILLIDVLGALDEATAAIGLARATAASTATKTMLIDVQRDLYRIMAGLAFSGVPRPADYVLTADRVGELESTIDDLTQQLPIAPQFILPGDSVAGATLDVARTVVRRAERVAVTLVQQAPERDPQMLPYLNRLSSLLFALARYEDDQAGITPLRAKPPAA